MLNISSKTKSHILVLIFGPHVPLWLPSIVTLHLNDFLWGWPIIFISKKKTKQNKQKKPKKGGGGKKVLRSELKGGRGQKVFAVNSNLHQAPEQVFVNGPLGCMIKMQRCNILCYITAK